MNLDDLRVIIYGLQNDIANKVNNLNYGGCIHFAYYLREALNSKNIPNKVVLCDSSNGKFDKRIKFLDSFSHIMIHIKGIGFVDGYRTIPRRKDVQKLFPHVRVTDKVNLQVLKDLDIWNEEYEKKKYNRKVEKIIKAYI